MDCLRYVQSQEHLAVSPKYQKNLNYGIKMHLRNMLFLYSKKLGGVPIAFSKVQRLHKNGYLVEEQPFLHIDVLVEFQVFQPEIGIVLKATVNKTGKDYVGCIIHGKFNGSVHKPYTEKSDWPGHKLHLGAEILFKVEKVFNNNGVMAFKGSIHDTDGMKVEEKVDVPEVHQTQDDHLQTNISAPNGLITIAPLDDGSMKPTPHHTSVQDSHMEATQDTYYSSETHENGLHQHYDDLEEIDKKSVKRKKSQIQSTEMGSCSEEMFENNNDYVNSAKIELNDSLEELSFEPPKKKRKKFKAEPKQET